MAKDRYQTQLPSDYEDDSCRERLNSDPKFMESVSLAYRRLKEAGIDVPVNRMAALIEEHEKDKV